MNSGAVMKTQLLNDFAFCFEFNTEEGDFQILVSFLSGMMKWHNTVIVLFVGLLELYFQFFKILLLTFGKR